MMPYHFQLKPLAAGLMTLAMAGCATFSQDGGLDAVSSLTRERTGTTLQRERTTDDATATQAAVAELIAKTLAPDSAVQLALRNNKGLQASLAELGVSEADLVQAGRMRNPGFGFGRQRSGDDVEIDRSVMFDLAGLLTMPMRTKIEEGRFEQAKLQAASSAVALAAATRRAYFNAVAAAQSVTYAEQVRTAAEAGAELARQLARVGNFSKLDQAREQVFYAETTTQLARARHNATATREELSRLMGVWGKDTGFRLPDRLPDLPKAANEAGDIEAQAMTRRLDVQMAKRDTEATASALGLTRATAFINVLDAGFTSKSAAGNPRANGYQVELVLPIFDWGAARSAKAESLYMQTVHRTADTAVRARSQVREAYSAYRTSYDIARHYRDEVVPLRTMISDEVLLRYNGMLASVFELLSDARDQVSSVNGAIEAQRDFWISETDLQAAIHGSGAAPSGDIGRGTTGASAPIH